MAGQPGRPGGMNGDWHAVRARRWAGILRAEDEPTMAWFRDATEDLSRAARTMAGPVQTGAALGPGLGLHHDGAASEIRLGIGVDTAPGPGLMLTMGSFGGSYVSITIDCPEGIIPRTAILSVWAAFEPGWAAPTVRLNLKSGADIERPAAVTTRLPEGVLAEFDLAALPPLTASGGWFDLIFPAMHNETLRVGALRIHMRRRSEG
jgi:hypothetical protein